MHITRIAAVTATFALAAGITACGTTPEADEETTLRLGYNAAEVSFDPLVTQVPGQWHVAAVYDSLFHTPAGIGMPGDGGVEPWLAEQWTYNDDKTVLTIELRDDVTFSDGAALDAEAVKANLDDYIAAVIGFEEVVVTDEHTLEVRLSQPNTLLLVHLADAPIASPAALEDRELLAVEPVGSGPYLLDEYATNSTYTFVRDSGYWNPEAFPYDRIEITLLPDLTARVNALKSGQVDVAYVDSATAAEMEAAGFSTTTGSAAWAGLWFGDREGRISAPIGNVKVRQAISMAMDRVGFSDAIEGGYGDPSNQLGVVDQPGFFVAERADEYAYDLEAAKELMAEAGYPDGFDIDIPESTYFATYIPYYRQAFEDLGIRVNWVPSGPDFLEYLNSGKYAILPYSAFIVDINVLDPAGFAKPWNVTSDAETAELLESINAGSEDEAFEAITALNEKALDEAWFAVLSHPTTIVAFAAGIDVRLNSLTKVPLQSITPAE
jgi:peptide/nickel transport system substrate-binding protein